MFFVSVAFILPFAFIFPVFKHLKRRDVFINIAVVFFRKSRNNPRIMQGIKKVLQNGMRRHGQADYNLALHFRPRRQVLLQPRVISAAHLGSRVTRLVIVAGVRRVHITRTHCANSSQGILLYHSRDFISTGRGKLYTRRDSIALRCFRRAYL